MLLIGAEKRIEDKLSYLRRKVCLGQKEYENRRIR